MLKVDLLKIFIFVVNTDKYQRKQIVNISGKRYVPHNVETEIFTLVQFSQPKGLNKECGSTFLLKLPGSTSST